MILVQPRADVCLKMNGNLGQVTLQEGVYKPILDLLAEHQAKSQRLVKDGVTLESEADNLAELTAQATEFADKQLPIFRALMVG